MLNILKNLAAVPKLFRHRKANGQPVKRSKQVIAAMLIISVVQCPVFYLPLQAAKTPENLYSTGAVLMDGDSGRVLYGKNEDAPLAMASTTKIMTCILALEYGTPGQIVTFSDTAAAMPDVQMNARAGEQYYLKDLLYSLMLESHNDSAVAVAEGISGSVEKFAALMNKKAEAIGCTHTNFVTPNGLDDTNEGGEHCTSPKDLALIMRYCVALSSKADEFLEITGTASYSFSEITGKRNVFCSNHNALLSSYPGAVSGKTGFTGKAGYCYVGAAKRDGKLMIISLLGAGWYPHKSYKWKDAVKLYNYGFDNYSYQKLGKSDWDFPDIPVIDGEKETIAIGTDAGEFTYLLGKGETVKCRVSYAKQIKAPVEKHTVIGNITYELHGKVIEQFQIFTMEETQKATLWLKIRRWVKNIF